MNEKPKLPAIFGDFDKERYLNFIAKGFLKCEAARAVNFHPSVIRDALKEDGQFNDALVIASAEYSEILEREAFNRALHGVRKSIYFQGDVCGTEIVLDNKLLMDMLKANNPEKFSTKKEITGKDGGAIEFVFKGFDAPAIPEEIQQEIAAEITDAEFEETDDD